MTIKTTLPMGDTKEISAQRKEIPLFSGPFSYFPAAIAGVAQVCKEGNDKHNPGEPLHHARGKSADHPEALLRHLMDLNDLIAADKRRGLGSLVADRAILKEVNQLAWRALALGQELHERYGGAPLAPGAVVAPIPAPVLPAAAKVKLDHELRPVLAPPTDHLFVPASRDDLFVPRA